MQAEVNIGLLGHVDHGKTTLTQALTGKWTDTHSEEIKRGISIRLGYADCTFFHCDECKAYSTEATCRNCRKPARILRKISFVDAPGHETLMTTVITASSIIDGALFLISASEQCPMPQTTEHLIVLESIGLKNIIVVQTKIDLVPKEKAEENYQQIKKFLKGTVAEDAPIIPISANYKINIDALIEAIEKIIPSPKRDENSNPILYVSRSFDVNRPGASIEKLSGGVIGGSLVKGKLNIGEKIEVKPGISRKGVGKPQRILFTIKSLREENEELKEARPGGLIAIGTSLDPALTKGDALVGTLAGKVDKLPDITDVFKVKYEKLERKDIENTHFKEGETVVVNIHTSTCVGIITNLSKGIATIQLKKPLVDDRGSKVAINRKIGQRWRLAAWGTLV